MLITCYYLNQDFFWSICLLYIRNCEFREVVCSSELSREALWLTSVLANDRSRGPGQGRGWASLGSDSPQNTGTPSGLEQNCRDNYESKEMLLWQQQLLCHCAIVLPWQLCRSTCSDPHPPQCTAWWDVYSPEQLRSQRAKDINKEDKSSTWTKCQTTHIPDWVHDSSKALPLLYAPTGPCSFKIMSDLKYLCNLLDDSCPLWGGYSLPPETPHTLRPHVHLESPGDSAKWFHFLIKSFIIPYRSSLRWASQNSLCSSHPRYDPVSFFLLLGHPQDPNSIPELWCHILRSLGLQVFQNQQRSIHKTSHIFLLIVFCSLGFMCQQSVTTLLSTDKPLPHKGTGEVNYRKEVDEEEALTQLSHAWVCHLLDGGLLEGKDVP